MIRLSNTFVSWANVSNRFVGFGLNVAATAYEAGSRLIQVKMNGDDKLVLFSNGDMKVANTFSAPNVISANVTATNVTASNVNATHITTTNVTASNVTTSNVSATRYNNLPTSGFKNKFINGKMDFWQRGTSGAVVNGQKMADRWYHSMSGSTTTASRQSFTLGQTDVPGEPKYFLRVVVTSVAGAGNYSILSHYIESVRMLAGKTATLSFYAKADAARNIAVEGPHQTFGTGGSPSASVSAVGVTCALTTSWQKFTITFSVPSISGKTIGTGDNDALLPHFWLDAGSTWNVRSNSLGQQSGTFDFAMIQLEEGSVASAFDDRAYGIELVLCQRYFETGLQPFSYNNFAAGISNGYGKVEFQVTKKAAPTIVMTSWQYYSAGITTSYTPLLDSSYVMEFRHYYDTFTNWTGYVGTGTWTADADF